MKFHSHVHVQYLYYWVCVHCHSQLPFMWAGGTKGLVNGFFFVGYLFFQVP